MDAVENITLFQNLIYISYAVLALGLGLAIFFFFYFKIPDVFMMMTGRAKKETVQRISEENFKTGKLRISPVTGSTKQSGKLKGNNRTGSLAAVHISADTGAMTNTASIQQAPETSVLAAPEAETSVLAAPEAETSVLAAPEAETSVLSSGEGGTAILETATQETSAGETAVLMQQPSIRFDVTETTIVIHTDEKVG